MSQTKLLVMLLVAMLTAGTARAASLELQAVLGESAVLNVNGERKLLRPGQSHGGVTLISTTVESASVTIDGKRQKLTFSRRVDTTYEQVSEHVVTIPRNSRHQYMTTALINGRSAAVLVDTGANVVALSASHAKSLGIDGSAGRAGSVETAGGVLAARQVTLKSVSVGGIRVDNVDATVVQSEYPATVLLGMSFLRHVRIEEQDGILSLSRSE